MATPNLCIIQVTQAVEQKSAISASLRAASEELASEAERNGELARELIQRPVKPKSLPTELLPIVARAIKGQIAAAKQMDERMQSQQAQVDQLSTVVTRQHTDNKELTEQVKQQGEKVEELSACVRKQHADNEELIGQLEQRREQVDELTACVAKQHADNEQMIGQLKQLQERIEELSTDARQQRADKGELISCVAEKEGEVAKLREQLRGKDRFVLEDDQRHALKERELEKRIQELTQERTQAQELSANLRQELETAQESRQQLALSINRRLSVRLRRSLHKLLDISQAGTPEPLRRALRSLYLPVYRLLFPSGKREFDTLDRLGSGDVSLKEDQGQPGGAA